MKRHFPDSIERVNYENQQLKVYRKAEKRLNELRRLNPLSNDHYDWLTPEEQTAFEYVNGTGSFTKFQQPSMIPNIYDTRETFLRKMENEIYRNTFLENWIIKKPYRIILFDKAFCHSKYFFIFSKDDSMIVQNSFSVKKLSSGSAS